MNYRDPLENPSNGKFPKEINNKNDSSTSIPPNYMIPNTNSAIKNSQQFSSLHVQSSSNYSNFPLNNEYRPHQQLISPNLINNLNENNSILHSISSSTNFPTISAVTQQQQQQPTITSNIPFTQQRHPQIRPPKVLSQQQISQNNLFLPSSPALLNPANVPSQSQHLARQNLIDRASRLYANAENINAQISRIEALLVQANQSTASLSSNQSQQPQLQQRQAQILALQQQRDELKAKVTNIWDILLKLSKSTGLNLNVLGLAVKNSMMKAQKAANTAPYSRQQPPPLMAATATIPEQSSNQYLPKQQAPPLHPMFSSPNTNLIQAYQQQQHHQNFQSQSTASAKFIPPNPMLNFSVNPNNVQQLQYLQPFSHTTATILQQSQPQPQSLLPVSLEELSATKEQKPPTTIENLLRSVVSGTCNIEKNIKLTQNAKKFLLNMADNFVENVGRASAQLALNRLKRRKKNVSPATNVYNSVTVNDIQIVLEKSFEMKFPGLFKPLSEMISQQKQQNDSSRSHLKRENNTDSNNSAVDAQQKSQTNTPQKKQIKKR